MTAQLDTHPTAVLVQATRTQANAAKKAQPDALPASPNRYQFEADALTQVLCSQKCVSSDLAN